MIFLTLGDPLGINTEIIAKAFAVAVPPNVTLVGSGFHLRDQLARLGRPGQALARLLESRVVKMIDLDEKLPEGTLAPAETLNEVARGQVAVAALSALKHLAPLDAKTRLAVVTGPIDKHAAHAAGFGFPGQTEFFQDLWQGDAVMTLAGARLRVGLATNHLALADVPRALTSAVVELKLYLFARTLAHSFGIAQPRVAVCGLNPHAGDQGLFGQEESKVLVPAIASARRRLADEKIAAQIFGPEAADTVFYRAAQGRYDGVLAMYHDQGLAPLKTLHFDDAVNLSGGLRHLRVSPDHGPARDLFLKGEASEKSLVMALALAGRYAAGVTP